MRGSGGGGDLIEIEVRFSRVFIGHRRVAAILKLGVEALDRF